MYIIDEYSGSVFIYINICDDYLAAKYTVWKCIFTYIRYQDTNYCFVFLTRLNISFNLIATHRYLLIITSFVFTIDR